jgi:hypothetical protein
MQGIRLAALIAAIMLALACGADRTSDRPLHEAAERAAATLTVGSRGDLSVLLSGLSWLQESKITEPGKANVAAHTFGASLAVSGTTAIVGAPADDDTGVKAGSVQVFVNVGDTWIPEAEIVPADAQALHQFGVSVSIVGDTLIAGAPGDGETAQGAGAAYVFTRIGGVWTQEAKLLASDGMPGDAFGTSVSFSGDTVIVGAPLSDAVMPDAGAAYVYVRSGSVWTEQAKLVEPNAAGDERFGQAVAVDGDDAAVGAPNSDENGFMDAGALYLFERVGEVWGQALKFTAQDGGAGDELGYAVSIHLGTVAAGAPEQSSGAVYVLVKSGPTWGFEQKIEHPTASSDFGASVSIVGDRLIVGAPMNVAFNTESATVLTRSGGVWTAQKYISNPGGPFIGFSAAVALDGDRPMVGAPKSNASIFDDDAGTVHVFTPAGTAAQVISPMEQGVYHQFGAALAFSGDTAIAGVPNERAAYVLVRSGADWIVEAKLSAPGEQSIFGVSVAIDGDTAVVGTGSVYQQSLLTAAYVFVRSGAVWSQQAKLMASDPQVDDGFGAPIAVDGDTVVVGAAAKDDASVNTGAAYVFVRSGGIFTQEAKLLHADPASNDLFGFSLALEGDTLIAGANYKDGMSSDNGAVYVFERSFGLWSEVTKLTAPDAAYNDQFGHAAALDGTTLVISAPQKKGPLMELGAVYIFEGSGAAWALQAELFEATNTAEQFGISVALDGTTAVVGAVYEDFDQGSSAGAAYVLTRSGNQWSQEAKLVASDKADDDRFGSAVAISGSTILAGAPYQLELGYQAGAIYVFTPKLAGGDPCALADECGSGFCVDGVCCNDACLGGAAGDCMGCDVPGKVGQCSYFPAGTECRASAEACDAAEACSGSTTECPPDALAPAGMTCRPEAGPCDAVETCDGVSEACPPDALVAAGTECRASEASCDVAEVCDGAGVGCPVDMAAADGTPCAGAGGVCEGGVCTMEGAGGAGGGAQAGSGGSGSGSGGSSQTGAGGSEDPGEGSGPGEEGGCGCRAVGVAGSGAGSPWIVLAACAALLRIARRRRGREEEG